MGLGDHARRLTAGCLSRFFLRGVTIEAWKKEALEKAGYAVGVAGDFLELSDEELGIVEVRVSLSLAIQARRKKAGMSQQQLADILGTSQPRVVKIEAGGKGVSLDQMFRRLFATGGSLADLVRVLEHPRMARRSAKQTPVRKKAEATQQTAKKSL